MFDSAQTYTASKQNALHYDGNASGQTIYAYVNGNPTNLTDPLGLMAANPQSIMLADASKSYAGNTTTDVQTSAYSGLALAGQTLGTYATRAGIAVAVGGGPEDPAGDVIGGGLLVTGTAIATVQASRPLIDKMASEIQGITERTLGPQGEVYSLRASQSGDYPNVRGGTTFLNAGDVYKYGETTQPDSRYSRDALQNAGLTYKTEFEGSQTMAKIVEKLRIYGHVLENGELPPGNRIFR